MAKEEQENEQGEKSGGKKKLLKIIIIAVIALILIIIIAAVAFIFLSGGKEDPNQQGQAAPAASPQIQPQAPIVQNAAPEQATPEVNFPVNNAEVGTIYPLPTFAMNLADPNGITFLKFGMSLDMDAKNSDLLSEVETKLPLIQDLVIMIVSSKAFEEINTVQGKSNLKRELLRRINERLTKGKITNVYITDFIVQK